MGESALHAILLSLMERIYCTFGFLFFFLFCLFVCLFVFLFSGPSEIQTTSIPHG